MSSLVQRHRRATEVASTSSSRISRRRKCEEDMVFFIHLPLRQAAMALGVSCSTIQSICRRNGVHRWPARRIAALSRRIAKLEKDMFITRRRALMVKAMDEWKKLTRERMDIHCMFMSL